MFFYCIKLCKKRSPFYEFYGSFVCSFGRIDEFLKYLFVLEFQPHIRLKKANWFHLFKRHFDSLFVDSLLLPSFRHFSMNFFSSSNNRKFGWLVTQSIFWYLLRSKSLKFDIIIFFSSKIY